MNLIPLPRIASQSYCSCWFSLVGLFLFVCIHTYLAILLWVRDVQSTYKYTSLVCTFCTNHAMFSRECSLRLFVIYACMCMCRRWNCEGTFSSGNHHSVCIKEAKWTSQRSLLNQGQSLELVLQAGGKSLRTDKGFMALDQIFYKCSHVGFHLSVCLKQLSQIVDFTSDGQRSRCSFLPPQTELQRRTVSLSVDNEVSHLHWIVASIRLNSRATFWISNGVLLTIALVDNVKLPQQERL